MPDRTILRSLVLGSALAVAGGIAHAQTPPLAPPFDEYGAKFACGPQTVDSDVVKGTYATSINIHNPQATISVPFIKKIVVALQEGVTPPGQIVVLQDNLGPDLAERIDCPLIIAKLGATATAHVEGFIVIEVPPQGATAPIQPLLDVVGKYTARTGAAGFDVVNYQPKHITQ